MIEDTEVSASSTTNTAKPKEFFLGVFAFIGFLASIVTIASYFSQKSGAKLEVEVYSNQFRTPIYAGGGLRKGKEAREFADQLRIKDCTGLDQAKISDLSYDDAAENKAQFGCKLVIDLEFAARWNGEHAADFSTMYEYNIRNNGDNVAKGIRIKAGNLNSMQYQRGGDFIDIKKGPEGEFFLLPDLSPQEAMHVLAWNNPSSYQSPFWREEDPPSITFDGSNIHIEKMIPVSDGWYNLYDSFIKDSSAVYVIISIIVFSFGIVLFMIFIISLPIHLYQGKSLRDFFKTDSTAKANLPKS